MLNFYIENCKKNRKETKVLINKTYHQTEFFTSAPNISTLRNVVGREVAFAGRSNAGKSSALNALTGQSQLARTSKTPGRTQLINFFRVTDERFLVDLPGYGFAQVPMAVKEKWQKALGNYLVQRKELVGLVVLMDIRHPMKDLDQQMIAWAVEANLPVLVLLTKADKLKSGARKAQTLKVQEAALAFCGDVTVEAFSSQTRLGLDALVAFLDRQLFDQ